MKEIHIRKMRAIEARQKLERELDAAFMSGETYVHIVHGIGEGILRKIAIEAIAEIPYVRILENPGFESNHGIIRLEILSPSRQEIRNVRR